MSSIPAPARPSPLALWLPRTLIVLLAFHLFRGVLPFAPVEGDELGVAGGLEAWARGTGDFSQIAYGYAIQSGSYHVLHFLGEVTGIRAFPLFCIANTVAVAGFVLCGSFLIKRATGIRPAWCAVALLLVPEIGSAAFYANTNALAALPLAAGLLLTQGPRHRPALWTAGVLIGFGGWLRLDSLLLSPLVLVLRLDAGRLGSAIRETAEIALLSVATLLAATAMCGLSWESTWREFSSRDSFGSWQPLGVLGWLVLGYTGTMLCVIGSIWLCLRQRWQPAALFALAAGMTLVLYGGSFAAPKYLYYAIPFLVLPGLALLSEGLGASNRLSRGLAWGFILLFLGEMFCGVQTASPFRRFEPHRSPLSIGPVTVAGKSLTMGFNEGELLPTVDGPRLRGGYFWAPGVWRREKVALLRETERLGQMLRSPPPELVLTSTYLAFRVVDDRLRQHGYRIERRTDGTGGSGSFSMVYVSDVHRLAVANIFHTPADTQEVASWAQAGRRTLFINDRGGVEFLRLSAQTARWTLRSPGENGLIAIYEYPSP